MATRRGTSFGARPRTAPGLASELNSIARQAESRRDSNIMDAWKNGGVFEGGKATDDKVLAYWKERLDEIDPSDPQADSYRDQIMQLQYGIEQSKMDLLHVQKKISDGKYAQFFLAWAKKAPKNSEFWRSLQKDAAGLLEQAKATGRANAQKAKTDAFNAFLADTQKHDTGIADALSGALDQLSKETGLSVTGNGDQLLAMLTTDVAANPNAYRELRDALKAGDPGFNGTFTADYYTQHLSQAVHGYDLIATRAYKDGFAQAYSAATGNQAHLARKAEDANVWPITKTYDVAAKAFERIWDDPTASIADKQKAATDFAAVAQRLSETKGIDEGTKVSLTADALRLQGEDGGDAPSFGATIGRIGVDPKLTGQIAYNAQQTQLLAENPGAFAYAPVDEKGNFDPTGAGAVGIVPAGALPGGVEFIAQTGMNGTAITVAVAKHTVFAADPDAPGADPVEIGKSISYKIGGHTVTMYQMKGVAGWVATNPTSDGSVSKTDKNGDITFTPPPKGIEEQLAKARELDKAYPGLNLENQMKTVASGGTVTDVSGTVYNNGPKGEHQQKVSAVYKDGRFVVTTSTMTRDTDGHLVEGASTPVDYSDNKDALATRVVPKSLQDAGDIPGVTFSSPLQASVAVASNLLSTSQMTSLAQDPLFQHEFLRQSMESFGTQNPMDPRISSAWENTTSLASTGKAVNDVVDNRKGYGPAADRGDLAYPGQNPEANKGSIAITFGSNKLTLPNLPSYLGNKTTDLSQFKGAADAISQGAQALKPFLPAASIPMLAAGAGAVTPTSTPQSAGAPSTVTPIATGTGASGGATTIKSNETPKAPSSGSARKAL